MRPIPVVFHIGPLQVHTYGIGLAITFWFAYRYFARRLRANGYPDAWLGRMFTWVVVAAIVGARAVHVVANLNEYTHNPGDIFAVWHGGLSSFGGLLFAFPVGLWMTRRGCPSLRLGVAVDILAPVLAAAWALGRLLGPQLMEAGGGKATTAWYGMYYADQVGKRLPVPIFQAIECTVIWGIAIAVERAVKRRGGPVGVTTAVTAGLWGLSRFFDEYFYLLHDNGTDAVEIAGLAFFGIGLIVAVVLLRRYHPPTLQTAAPEDSGDDPVALLEPAIVGGETRTRMSAPDEGRAQPV